MLRPQIQLKIEKKNSCEIPNKHLNRKNSMREGLRIHMKYNLEGKLRGPENGLGFLVHLERFS